MERALGTDATRIRGQNAIQIALPHVTPRVTLDADLVVPLAARGLIMFAHGSGSGRHSPRNRTVAAILRDAGFATLLLDLLTLDEEQIDASTREYRFDITLLADRLTATIDWAAQDAEIGHLPLGLFGASTGAAAALIAAARRPTGVAAIVSRGGRPDLAGDALEQVRAPTLLIVGGYDTPVIDLNRDILPRLHCPKQLAIIPQATHLFEEPGALDHVARLARDWFRRYVVL